MAKNGAMPEQGFSLEKYYMFFFQDGNIPTVIVERPTIIRRKLLIFHFSIGNKSESATVHKSAIIAVGDDEVGTVRVLGWSGKYIILNQTLFDDYLKKEVIKLKRATAWGDLPHHSFKPEPVGLGYMSKRNNT